MASTIYGITNYYSMLASPLKSYQVNPDTNLMYGAIVSQKYGSIISNNLKATMSSYLSSLTSNTTSLKTSSSLLVANNKSQLYTNKKVSVSDSTSISATANSKATVADYTLNVSQLASSQLNTGKKLDSNKLDFNQGVNSFSLKVGNSNAINLSYTVTNSDTNKSTLTKMADTINNAKTGVTASVINDTKTNTSYINLSSDKTGTDNAFTLADVTGNSVSASNANNQTDQAKNATYSVNGNQTTSQSNDITLDNGNISITLNKATGKDISLKVTSDDAGLKKGIENLVKNYNNTVKFANNNSDNFNGAKTLSTELGRIATSQKASLSSIGLTINNDRTITIDDTKLTTAIKNKSNLVDSIIGGKSGLAQNLVNKSTEVSLSTYKYAQPVDFSTASSSFYNAISPNASLSFGQNMYSGSLLDSLV